MSSIITGEPIKSTAKMNLHKEKEAPHCILLSGKPGIGKTTAILFLADMLQNYSVLGFYTAEIRINGNRQGFELVTYPECKKGLLASPSLPGEPRFGALLPDGTKRLGIDLSFLNNTICPMLEQAIEDTPILLVDEIGLIQTQSDSFKDLLMKAYNSSILILGTIPFEKNEWLESFCILDGVLSIGINLSNRNEIPNILYTYLEQRLTSEGRLGDGSINALCSYAT